MKLITLTTTILLATSAAAVADSHGDPAQAGAHFIENWDLDGDGQVTLREATEKRGDVFYMFDKDENDVLDDAEYLLFDETRQADMNMNAGGYKKGPMKRANRGLSRDFNDTDGNGEVSKEEFTIRSSDWFDLIDRNSDGVVTKDDFGPDKS